MHMCILHMYRQVYMLDEHGCYVYSNVGPLCFPLQMSPFYTSIIRVVGKVSPPLTELRALPSRSTPLQLHHFVNTVNSIKYIHGAPYA